MSRAVVDQPALKYIFLGLFLSLFLGLAIKSQVGPHKIQKKLHEALVRLEPDVKINFSSAEVRLTEWGWPRPYIIIRNITASPTKAVCQDSQIYLETLSFPLTWNLLFEKEKKINGLHISEAELRLGEINDCFNSKENSHDQGGIFATKTAAELNQIKMDHVRIISKKNYGLPIDLQSALFSFEYEKNSLKKILLNSQLLSFKDEKKNLYRFKSDFDAEIFSVNGFIQLKGKIESKSLMRSPIIINLLYSDQEKKLVLDSDFSDLPLKSLLNLLQTLNPQLAKVAEIFQNYKTTFTSQVLLKFGDNGILTMLHGKQVFITSPLKQIYFDQVDFKIEPTSWTLEAYNRQSSENEEYILVEPSPKELIYRVKHYQSGRLTKKYNLVLDLEKLKYSTYDL